MTRPRDRRTAEGMLPRMEARPWAEEVTMEDNQGTSAADRGSALSEGLGPALPPPCPDPDSRTTAALVAWAVAYADRRVAAERERIINALPGGHSVNPQWVADMVRWPERA